MAANTLSMLLLLMLLLLVNVDVIGFCLVCRHNIIYIYMHIQYIVFIQSLSFDSQATHTCNALSKIISQFRWWLPHSMSTSNNIFASTFAILMPPFVVLLLLCSYQKSKSQSIMLSSRWIVQKLHNLWNDTVPIGGGGVLFVARLNYCHFSRAFVGCHGRKLSNVLLLWFVCSALLCSVLMCFSFNFTEWTFIRARFFR